MTHEAGGKQAGRRLGGGAVAALIGLAVLVIFIIQNTADIRVHFLFWYFTWALWIYTIVMALFGALAWFGLGVMRRRRRRSERRLLAAGFKSPVPPGWVIAGHVRGELHG